MTRAVGVALMLGASAFLLSGKAWAQGETTSAIVGTVMDSTNAVVAGATVTVANHEIGLRRTARTDEAGRYNFPQLKPGMYSVRAEAQGFEPAQDDGVVSSLGQKQTVDFTLNVARSNDVVEVNGAAR